MKLSARRTPRLQIDNSRRGATLLTVALALTFLLGCVALGVDIGFMVLADGELQAVADASALAAARELDGLTLRQDEVAERSTNAAVDTAASNSAGGFGNIVVNDHVRIGGETFDDIRFGHRTYDPATGEHPIAWGEQPFNCVQVTARLADFQRADSDGNPFDAPVEQALPLLFMAAVGREYADVEATATATYQPRDMMLVLDESGSMRFDSLFFPDTRQRLGTEAIVDTLEEMWEDLGYPTYGNMDFEAEYPTFEGVKTAQRPQYYYGRFYGYETVDVPDISIRWRGNAVDISSDERIDQVVLLFANNTFRFYDVNASHRTIQSNVRVTAALVRSGNNGFLDPFRQGLGEYIDLDSNSAFERALGVDSETYPYNHGYNPWRQYIDYVRSDSYIRAAGFQNRFGMLTLIHFWNDSKHTADLTPDLARTRQQPMGALKESVNQLLDYIVDVEADDKVGLVTFSTEATLETELSFELDEVREQTAQMQPDATTNIAGGMRLARIELSDESRPQAARTIVLMTDGVPTDRYGRQSQTERNKARQEAEAAAEAGIRVITISLGSRSDHSLMTEIAEITGGVHHEVADATAADPEALERGLQEVFAEIAADRSLMLIR